MKRLRIGVIGFRGESVNLLEAKEKLCTAFNTIEQDFPDVTGFEVYFDLLNLGVSPVALEVAEAMRWRTWGILRAFNRADRENYGYLASGGVIGRDLHEGDVILKEVDVLVRIGGSKKRQQWAEEFKRNGGHTYEYDLTSS